MGKDQNLSGMPHLQQQQLVQEGLLYHGLIISIFSSFVDFNQIKAESRIKSQVDADREAYKNHKARKTPAQIAGILNTKNPYIVLFLI